MITPANKLKYFRNEHKISHWLYEKGFKRKSIACTLEAPYKRLHDILKRPAKHLTIQQMMLISGMVQRPFSEVFFAVLSLPNLEREMKKRWDEETGIELDYIFKPE